MIGKPEETIKLVGRVGRLEGSSDSSDDITGCSLNIVFFPIFIKYSELCFPFVSVCVHVPGR